MTPATIPPWPNEETEGADIGKGNLEIGREDGLKGSADSPEVGNFRPAGTVGKQGDDSRNHRPIAKLKRQRLLPMQELVSPEINRIAQIIRGEE